MPGRDSGAGARRRRAKRATESSLSGTGEVRLAAQSRFNGSTHEVFFRDMAHGFVTWAVATVVAAVIAAAGASAASTHAAAGALAAVTPDAGQVDATRKAAAAASVFTALSMVIGAFIACVAAALGGSQRDERQEGAG